MVILVYYPTPITTLAQLHQGYMVFWIPITRAVKFSRPGVEKFFSPKGENFFSKYSEKIFSRTRRNLGSRIKTCNFTNSCLAVKKFFRVSGGRKNFFEIFRKNFLKEFSPEEISQPCSKTNPNSSQHQEPNQKKRRAPGATRQPNFFVPAKDQYHSLFNHDFRS